MFLAGILAFAGVGGAAASEGEVERLTLRKSEQNFDENIRKGNYRPSGALKVDDHLKGTSLAKAGRNAAKVSKGLSLINLGVDTGQAIWAWPETKRAVRGIQDNWIGFDLVDASDPAVYLVDGDAGPPNRVGRNEVTYDFEPYVSGNGNAVYSLKHDYLSLPEETNRALFSIGAEVECKRRDGSRYTVLTGPSSPQFQYVQPLSVNELYACNSGEKTTGAVIRSKTFDEHWGDLDLEARQYMYDNNWMNKPPRKEYWGIDYATRMVGEHVPVEEKDYFVTNVCVLPDGARRDLTVKTPGSEQLLELPDCGREYPGSYAESESISGEPRDGGLRIIEQTVTRIDYVNYPECVGLADCRMTLELDGNLCTVGLGPCVEWTELILDDPSRLTCKYGPYVLDIAECFPLERSFEDHTAVGDDANTDGDPDTRTEPAPPAGDEGDSCVPEGWGEKFNPLLWVTKPVGCALDWAFTPSPDVVEEVGTKAGNAWDESPPGQLQGIVSAWKNHLPEVSGCQGPGVNLHLMGMGPGMVYPLDACEGRPAAGLANAARTVGAMGLYLGAALAVTRYLAASVGYRGFGSNGGDGQ